jgi:hypothetical protein
MKSFLLLQQHLIDNFVCFIFALPQGAFRNILDSVSFARSFSTSISQMCFSLSTGEGEKSVGKEGEKCVLKGL